MRGCMLLTSKNYKNATNLATVISFKLCPNEVQDFLKTE